MAYELAVRNGIIVNSREMFQGDLYVSQGKVAAISAAGAKLEAEQEVDAAGRYVLPGVVDPHVHAGHGTPERETFACAGMAAASGGITTILEQPLSVPPTVTAQAFFDKMEEGAKSFAVDYGFWGGVVPGHLEDVEAVQGLGAGAFKSFMCRCSNYPMTPDGLLLRGLQRLSSFGGLLAVHAENDTLIQELVDCFNADGRDDAKAFLDSHPPYSELEAVLRFIFLAKQAPGCKAHVVHCSLPECIDAVYEARSQGVDITAETCPQYLALCHDDLYALGGVAKCDPPVRSRETVEELWKRVLEGKVDLIASDHSPHPLERKEVDPENFGYASEGVTGLETLLPVVLEEGVAKRDLPLTDVVRLTSENSARRFGLYGRKGALDIGFDADFNIIDLHRSWLCRKEDMHYLNKHTPFDRRSFRGHIESTWLRGTMICKNRKVLVEPGFGQFLKMEMTPGGNRL